MTRALAANSAGSLVAALRRGLLAGLAFCAALAAPGAAAQGAEAPEASVKAAFIFKFAGYIEWTASAFPAPDTPLVIGVIGADEVAAELERIVPGRNVAGHPVVVRRVKQGEALRGMQMLFIGRAEAPAQPALLRAAQSQGVLAITESAKALEQGSAINFVVYDNRVGFEVSLDSAEKSGYRISSRMLTVARRVIPKSS